MNCFFFGIQVNPAAFRCIGNTVFGYRTGLTCSNTFFAQEKQAVINFMVPVIIHYIGACFNHRIIRVKKTCFWYKKTIAPIPPMYVMISNPERTGNHKLEDSKEIFRKHAVKLVFKNK